MMTVDIRALLNRVNRICTQAMEAAAGQCLSRLHYEVTIEHVLGKLLDSADSDIAALFDHFACDRTKWNRAIEIFLEGLRTGNSGKPVFSPLLVEWLQEAWLIASIDLGDERIRSGALFLAMLRRPERFTNTAVFNLLRAISKDELDAKFKSIISGSTENAPRPHSSGDEPSAMPGGALAKYCTDFTQKAAAGQVDPVFGRDREIYQMIDILARRRKNNPILVGEAGVGKTAVVEGLALKIIKGDVPEALKNVAIMGLDMGLLQAGAGVQGEFENRLKSVIQEMKASVKPLILFIDEAHTLIGAGGSAGQNDAANLLKPALARGELRTIAATTWSEYKKYFEKDPALARRFQPVKLEEPSVEAAVRILRGLKPHYEAAHGVVVRDSAIVAAAEYASRYISGRQLPDKAVDLLDTCAARVKGMLTAKPAAIEDQEREMESLDREKQGLLRDALHGGEEANDRQQAIDLRRVELQSSCAELTQRWRKEQALAHQLIALRKQLVESKDPVHKHSALELSAELKRIQNGAPLIPTDVDPDTVAQVVSDWTGIPLGKVLRDEAASIGQLEENLSKRIKGQDAAVKQIGQALRASKLGLKDPQQPLGVFLLVGPSGVGKTETALSIADLLFGGDRFLHTINMSEFHESHSVSRLIGSPPGYVGYGEGGLLTEAVRQKPYSVVLIDEVEKGHLDVMNLFYQVFDKGVLADGEGRSVDFKNTVLFLTSNLASDVILKLCANGTPTPEQISEAIRPAISRHFKPALLARMTVVPYRPLESPAIKEIVRSKLQRLSAQVRERHKITLIHSEAMVDQITARCREVDSGARTIDHVLRDSLLPQLSQEILARMGSDSLPSELHLGLTDGGQLQLLTPSAPIS